MLDKRLRIGCVACAVMVALGAACGSGGDDDTPTEAAFVMRACRGSEHAPVGELFRVLIRDPAVIAEADALVGAGDGRFVAGNLVGGDGGFNQPWSWHLDPESIAFVEMSVEVCDGCPSFIEADLAYWIDTVGQYCPASSEVVARER